MDNIIEVKDLSYKYTTEEETNILVLDDVSISIKKGEFLSILGHNGSGKSTFAKHFNALLLPCGGKVFVKGMDTTNEELTYDIRKKVGMVFQNPDNQLVATVVEEDVAFACENLGVESSKIRTRVDDALKSVGLYEYRKSAPHMMSGGQKQRVAIAGIIAMRPECIVLDEPTAMLDPMGRKEVLSTIRKLSDEFGLTIILITHYMDEAAMADRLIILENGKIFLEGTPKEVFSQVDKVKETGLDAPQTTELLYELSKDGIDVNYSKLSIDECVAELKRLLEE